MRPHAESMSAREVRMTQLLRLISLALLFASCTVPAARARHRDIFLEQAPMPTLAQEQDWVGRLSTPLAPGDVGPRLLTAERTEVPDPSRPLPIRLPGGDTKFAVGLSGGHLLLVNRLEDLAHGGLKPLSEMRFFNRQGHEYGKEINSATGLAVPYVWSSALWDGAFVYTYRPTSDGSKTLALLALGGGMADNPQTGYPFTMADGKNNTRQRLFFAAEFRESPAGSGHQVLTAFAPYAPLNRELPDDKEWVKMRDGKTLFNHGYGGGPVALLNGDLYIDPQGRVPVVYEAVVDEQIRPDPLNPGKPIRTPGRTAIFVVYMDEGLQKVLTAPEILMDVYREDGALFQAAKRRSDGLGPLVEGGHVTVMNARKPVASREELLQMRAAGLREDFDLHFSMGEYYGAYGSYKGFSQGKLTRMRPVVGADGEPLDITAPLRVLFTWLGRPVPYYTRGQGRPNGQKNLLVHGVPRSSLPTGITFDTRPREADWPLFNRQLLSVPIEEYLEDGMWKERLMDSTGLLDELQRYRPRPVSRIHANAMGSMPG